MGLRGFGAKPRKKPEVVEPVRYKRPPMWQWPSRTRAERVIAFCNTLPITSGLLAGKKMKLRPWQVEIIRDIYATGPKGKRRIRQGLITLPRKNGKTSLAAALALAHLVGPEAEARGQIVSAAADREQAALIFNEIEAIVKVTPWMDEVLNVQRFKKKIEHLGDGSTFQALSSEAKTKHGLSPSFIIYDELAQAPDRELFDVLATSSAARKEPLMITISTQSADPLHVMSELTEHGRRVNAGELVDRSFHATIFAAPVDADPWSESTWRAANPALGDFRSLEEMRDFASRAKSMPSLEATFRNLYLNQPVTTDDRFVTEADWAACGAEPVPAGPCYGGLDLGSVRDLTAFSLFWPETNSIKVWSWIPGFEMPERERRDKVPFRLWIQAGHVEISGARATDQRVVGQRIAQICHPFDLQQIGFDRWGIEVLQNHLRDEDIALPLVEFGQGFRTMAPAITALERLILSHDLRHGNSPVLRWCAANAAVDTDPAGNRKFSKRKAISRIDALIAATMAIGQAAREPVERPLEVWPLLLQA